MKTVATSKPSSVVSNITSTSVGKKYLMAISGFMAVMFVIGHMLGNLQLFIGQDQLNTYAAKLQSLGPLLYLIRAALFVVIIVHIYKGIQLKLENWAARPDTYKFNDTVQASLASRTMIWTGLIILAFVVYHLMHFTLLWINPDYHNLVDSLGRHDVYSMVIIGFQNIFVSAFYVIAVGLLCWHLSHGISSMFQSIGWQSPKYQPMLAKIAWTISILLFLGYVVVPISILAGLVKLPEGGM